MKNKQIENIYIRSVNKAIDFMEIHYSEKITLEILAAEGCFSAWHFHRIFKGIVGETPQEYLNRVRLEKAIMFMDQNYSITKIALATGFSTSSHFCKTFKKQYSLSPKQWYSRKLMIKAENKKKQFSNFSDQNISFKVQEFPLLSIAYIRNIGSYDYKIGFTWKKLMSWARKNNLVSITSLRLSCSWDSPDLTPDGKLRYDACIILPADIDKSIQKYAPVSFRSIKSGRYAIFPFEGNISQLSNFYNRVYGELLPSSALKLGETAGYRSTARRVGKPEGGFCSDIGA